MGATALVDKLKNFMGFGDELMNMRMILKK